MPEPKLGESRTALDVAEIIASRRFGGFQFSIAVLSMLALFSAGFITQIVLAVAPPLARSMGVNPSALAPVLAYANYGSLVGLLLIAPLADWIGRKPILLGSMVLFTVATLAAVWAQTVSQLAVLRFVAGVGLGGIVPSALAITADYMPRRTRSMLVLVVWSGFGIGAGVAGPIAAYTLIDHRWPAVFVLGAFLPIILLPLIWTGVPESLLLLVHRGEAASMHIRAGLIRISRRYDRLRVSEFTTSEPAETGLPFLLLFRHDRAPVTALLWILFFAGLMMLFFINAWTPSVLKKAELSNIAATAVAAAMQLFAILGGFGLVFLAERFNRYYVIGGAFVLGAIGIIAMGMFNNTILIASVVIMVGVFALGALNAAVAIVTTGFPSGMRATGIGWALGIGRNGQILGPMVGGYILALKLDSSHVFFLLALPAFAAAAAAIAIAVLGRRFGGE